MQLKYLEYYIKTIWPLQRKFVRISKRCSRCIVSEKYTKLNEGLCEECSNFKIQDDLGIQQYHDTVSFEKYISSIITDNLYDCVLMLSGGKDSAYILYRLRTYFPKLKILCVFVENGFSSPVAISNAEQVTQLTKTDLIIVNSFVDKFKEVFQEAFLTLKGRPSYSVIDYADGSTIFEVGKTIARQFNIPIIGGLSWVQVQHILNSDDFKLESPNDPTIIFPLVVWRTNEQDIRKYVRDKHLLHSDSPLATNNQLIPTICALDIKQLGYCSFEPEIAQLVREGKTDRKFWLYLFESLEYSVKRGYLDEDIRNTLKQLNLKMEQVLQ